MTATTLPTLTRYREVQAAVATTRRVKPYYARYPQVEI
jgi:hypothetical protein